jgi:hypothetical protein
MNRTKDFSALSSWLIAASVGLAGQTLAQEPVQEPLLPANAKPGECYTRVFIPTQYETVTEDVVKKEATEHVETVPPTFEWVEEQVLVKEASEEIEVIPAVFKTVTDQVLVKPESEEIEVVPAEYEAVEEKVLVRQAYTAWKTGRGPIEKIDTTTGEIMCLVEVPAEYKTVQKQVLKTPPTTRVVTKPAEYETVEKQVVDVPAQTRVVKIPAEYRTVKVQRLVKPAQEVRAPVPAEYETVTKTVKKSDGHVEWRPILCETNVTPEIITKIQEALKERGFYRGVVDGRLGPQSIAGIRAFQRENDLPSGQLTLETLEALEVKL